MGGLKSLVKCMYTCGNNNEVSNHKGGCGSMAPTGVQLVIRDRYVVMDNGIVQVTLLKPEGIVTGISYNGIDNLLEVQNAETNRGYWDVVWNALDGSGKAGIFEVISATDFKVVKVTEEQVELSFARPWDPSLQGKLAPINVDKRFILLRGCSGFYSYAIYEHVGLPEWPAFSLGETRIAFKLRKDKFHFMAVADDRKRFMPLPDDRLPGRGQALAYPEAVVLVNPVEPMFRGEVDDKYQYSCDNKDLRVHGWISMDPLVGFWQITPSDEFRSGGPLKQNLSSHVGPTTLAMFLSSHYAGEDLVPKFEQGEQWKKVFGPVFIYLNSVMSGEDPLSLWDDAKIQMVNEVQSWPYSFPESEDFPSADQRGSLRGRLFVQDKYISDDYIPAYDAYVGLAPPGEVGSWQRECKDYQFWSKADMDGYFSINNARTGDYNFYAWVPGFLGDYRNEVLISITPGCDVDIGDIVYQPPRDGPTLWEIGIPDRTAAEFYIPDPNPKYINKIFVYHPEGKFRQYGLWERYSDIYPDGDLVYTVGKSDYTKDWFFAQVPSVTAPNLLRHHTCVEIRLSRSSRIWHFDRRKVESQLWKKQDNTYEGTTWQIKFNLYHIDLDGTYKLRVAIASATLAEVQVRVNNPNTNRPLFTTGLIGRDNSIARHGIHGLYWMYNVDIQGTLLVVGDNTIYLTQPRCASPFQGIMYDYIRLEAPDS